MKECTVWLLTAGRLVLPVTGDLFPVMSYLEVAKLAHGTETSALLPKTANNLIANCSFTVPKRTTVSFSAGGVVVKVAVISMVSHNNPDVSGVTEVSSDPEAASIQGQQDLRQQDTGHSRELQLVVNLLPNES